MSFYKNLFYLLFSFLKSFEGGFSYQSNDTRALEVVMFISFLELFNLMSLFPSTIVGKVIIIPLLFIFGVNYLAFYYRGRYKKVVESFQLMKVSGIYRGIVILYLVATIVVFWVTR